MTIPEAIYLLSAATSLVAAALLFRQHRHSRTPLLFWSFVGFVGLAVNNVLVYVDLVLVPTVDLVLPRAVAGAAGLVALLYGLLWESGG
jgi:hypothetical protein